MKDLSMNMIQQEKALFDKWQGDMVAFVRDGLVDEDAYVHSNLRVVFALKDAYGDQESWHLCDYIRDTAVGHTWATVARWCYGLQNIHRDVPWQEVEPYGAPQNPDKRKVLLQAGFMNMKKVPGAVATTDIQAVRNYVGMETNRGFLERQWKIYSPQLTVCGGWLPFESMLTVLAVPPGDIQLTTRGQRYWKTPHGGFVLESCHPAAQYAASLKYYMMLDAARELLA